MDIVIIFVKDNKNNIDRVMIIWGFEFINVLIVEEINFRELNLCKYKVIFLNWIFEILLFEN